MANYSDADMSTTQGEPAPTETTDSWNSARKGSMLSGPQCAQRGGTMTVDSVFGTIMDYDPFQDSEIEDAEAAKVRVWLRDNPEQWLVDRQTLRVPYGESQEVLLYVGEEGSGKTTLLTLELERTNAVDKHLPASGTRPPVVVLIDFSHGGEVRNAPLDDNFDNKVGEFIRRRVEESVRRDQVLYERYLAARLRFVLREYGTAVFSDKRIRQIPLMLNLPDDELLDDDGIVSAVREFVGKEGERDIALRAVQSLSQFRTVIVVDNVDHLGPARVGRLFAFLSSAIDDTTFCYVGIRTELQSEIQEFRHKRRVEVVTLQNDGAVFAIMLRRIAAADSYLSIMGLSAQSSTKAKYLRNAVHTIAEDASMANLLENWNNGNLRQMMGFIKDISMEVATNKNPHETSGVFYSQLIQRTSSETLTEMLSPTHVPTENAKPFVFLSLRILSYLHKRKGIARLNKMESEFRQHFGIRATILEGALADLEMKPHVSGAFLRVESEPTKADTVVRLLPAGRVFVDHMVFTCDYLAWVYDHAKGMPAVNLQGNKMQIKLNKSVAVVKHRILPALVQEHPYMREGHKLKDPDSVRLDSYQTMFGYTRQKWFITRLLGEMMDYAESRRLQMSELNPLNRTVRDYTNRLDYLVSDEFRVKTT
jgi:hypothetical protein